jgi:hypothetical protein
VHFGNDAASSAHMTKFVFGTSFHDAY